jgi:hypothetical protein
MPMVSCIQPWLLTALVCDRAHLLRFRRVVSTPEHVATRHASRETFLLHYPFTAINSAWSLAGKVAIAARNGTRIMKQEPRPASL